MWAGMGTLGLLRFLIFTIAKTTICHLHTLQPSPTLCSHHHVIKLALIPRGKTSHHKAYMNYHDILLLLRVDWLLQHQWYTKFESHNCFVYSVGIFSNLISWDGLTGSLIHSLNQSLMEWWLLQLLLRYLSWGVMFRVIWVGGWGVPQWWT